MANFVVPTAADLRLIEQDLLPDLMADDPIFQFFPITEAEAELLIWEQLDNFQGLQGIRGIGGAPGRVAHVGLKQYIAQPGYYGEYKKLDEAKILRQKKFGTFGDVTNVTDLVLQDQVHLLQRRLNRIRQILWNIAQGTYSVSTANGIIMATDTYTLQTFTASVTWATSATATPFADFRTVKTKHRGHSVNFGASAKAIMNLVTYNNMIGNTNASDLFGKRFKSLSTISSLGEMTGLLNEDDLPTPMVYDEGYLSDGTDGNAAGTFVPFIPNGVVIVFGKRPNGTRIGEYRMTRNLENPNLAAGAYTKVIVQDKQVPTSIETHDGHNGGPVIEFPSSIVVMSV
jgi:hypothetical protein